MPFAWPPEFFVLPCGSGIVKADIRPCRKCGSEFVVVQSAAKLCSYQCPKCCRSKPGDRVLGTIDRETWTIRRGAR